MNNKKNLNYFKNNPNFLQYSEPNIIKQKKEDFYFQDINDNKNRNININKMSKNKKVDMNLIYSSFSKKNEAFLDMRIYYCLKMLGLGKLQNIFEKNNISFYELLFLSKKDLGYLGIPREAQIIINKFSVDYIKSASYYSLDELQNYFRKIKILYSNSRITNSARFLNKREEIINGRNQNNNVNLYYSNNNKNIYQKYNSFSNRVSHNSITNMKNNKYLINNLINNQENFKRNNSATVNTKNSLFNRSNIGFINNINNNINLNKNYNSINFDQHINNKYLKINNISNSNSLNSFNIKNTNNDEYSSSNYNQSNLTNFEIMKSRKNNKNNLFEGNLRENIIERQTQNKRFHSEQNNKIRKLNEFEKKKINSILSKRIYSIQKKPLNENKMHRYNINNNNIENNFFNIKNFFN